MSKVCCQNCGHESHCGAQLQKPIQSYFHEIMDDSNITICGYCRCELCTNVTTELTFGRAE